MKTYKRYRFPDQIISHAIWLYHRFTLSFRDIEELLQSRGIIVSYESIRQWCLKLAPPMAKQVRKRMGQLGDQWFLDEVFIKINGQQHYLWRAVDQDGCELDILVTKKRDKKAAMRFFKKLFKCHSKRPAIGVTTDKLRSYHAALDELGSAVPRSTEQYANDLAEISHQKTRQQQRQMRQFKSMEQAQRFLACHGAINNHARHQRHLLSACNFRILLQRSFDEWNEMTCARNLDIAG
tara:strand:+ start:122 stop:832 length:711 start_codon:yes stop_codon:yes gene_type:complete